MAITYHLKQYFDTDGKLFVKPYRLRDLAIIFDGEPAFFQVLNVIDSSLNNDLVRLTLGRIVKAVMNAPVFLRGRAGFVPIGRGYADLGAAASIGE